MMIMKKTLILPALLLMYACGDILETDISGKEVHVTAPVDNAGITEGNMHFLWDVLDGAEKYHVSVVTPDFEHAVTAIKDTLVFPDSLAVSLGFRMRLAAGKYQWSMQAFNSACGSVRSVFDLTVIAEPDEAAAPDETETQ